MRVSAGLVIAALHYTALSVQAKPAALSFYANSNCTQEDDYNFKEDEFPDFWLPALSHDCCVLVPEWGKKLSQKKFIEGWSRRLECLADGGMRIKWWKNSETCEGDGAESVPWSGIELLPKTSEACVTYSGPYSKRVYASYKWSGDPCQTTTCSASEKHGYKTGGSSDDSTGAIAGVLVFLLFACVYGGAVLAAPLKTWWKSRQEEKKANIEREEALLAKQQEKGHAWLAPVVTVQAPTAPSPAPVTSQHPPVATPPRARAPVQAQQSPASSAVPASADTQQGSNTYSATYSSESHSYQPPSASGDYSGVEYSPSTPSSSSSAIASPDARYAPIDSASSTGASQHPPEEEELPRRVFPDLPDPQPAQFINFSSLSYLRKLGAGNFGMTFQATWAPRSGGKKLVVLKVPKNEAGTSDWAELRAVRHLPPSKFVLGVLGLVTDFSTDRYRNLSDQAIVVPFFPQGSLGSWLKRQDLDAAMATHIALSMARGVQHMHKFGFLHRDIAARNFLVADEQAGQPIPDVVLADFGLSITLKKLDKKERDQKPETLPFPWRWCPPECGTTRFPWSPASDVWSLGVAFWEIWHALEGGLPFAQVSSPKELFDKLKKEELALASDLPSNCPADFAQLVRDMHIANPVLRPDINLIVLRLEAMAIQYQ